MAILIASLVTTVHLIPAASGAGGAKIVPVRVVGGLRQAVSFTFDPMGRIWFVEKADANVQIFDPATGDIERFMHVPDVIAQAEQGLVGIELHPRFPEPPWVFLYATRMVNGVLRDQLMRVTAARDRGTDLRVLWESPASTAGQGSSGRLLFGPDEALYVAVGDAHEPALAQDASSDRGKILRMTGNGTPAPGNPVPDSLVFASGIRNSFGFAFDPATGNLWETENGPECNDEVNLIEAGANYGWGSHATCPDRVDPASTSVDGARPVAPQLTFTPTIAPTGIVVCHSCGLGGRSEGALFFGDYNLGHIHRATLAPTGDRIVADEVIAQAPDLVLSLELAPDGSIYFSSYIAIFRLEFRGRPGPSPTDQLSPEPSQVPSSHIESPSSSAGTDRGSGGTVLLVVGIVLVLVAALAWLPRWRRNQSERH